jgi:Arc/MetJ family transcription regulator
VVIGSIKPRKAALRARTVGDIDDELIATAHHEAGHLVAYLYAGVRPRRVSIVPARGWLGHTIVYDSWGIQTIARTLGNLDDESQQMVRRAQRVRFERTVIALLAGSLAEQQITGRESAGSHEDHARAEFLIASFVEPGREAGEYLAMLHLEAELLIRRLWRHVEAVAHELLERRTIDDDAYFEDLEDALWRGLPPSR